MKPKRGTPESWRLLEERVREYLLTTSSPSRDGFLRFERTRRAQDERMSNRDTRQYPGGWGALLKNARGGADISTLDYEDLKDTDKVQHAVREAEPKEILQAKREREKANRLKRKLDETLKELANAEARQEILERLTHAPSFDPIVPRDDARDREATAVSLWSDWHVEEIVDPAEVGFRNAYNPAICAARVQRLVEGTLWLTEMHRERFAIRDLCLWLGGDFISGYIHEELEETNGMGPPEAALFAQRLIGGAITTLLDQGSYERIVVPCNVGNHGRIHKRRRIKRRAKNSYEFMIYANLAEYFRHDPRVEFSVAGGSHTYLDVYGQRIRFHHGDDVRYWGGVGGLSIPLNKAIRSWQTYERADLTCIGHFHQYLHGRDFVVNGSLIGYNAFALSIKAEYEDPQQAFFLVDKRRGRTCKSPIWVEERNRDWRSL